MGDIKTNSRPGSRASVFSEEQYETGGGRRPITEQHEIGSKHLAVKAEDWDEMRQRKLYAVTLVYMEDAGNDSWGSRLSRPEAIKADCGPAIGPQSERL